MLTAEKPALILIHGWSCSAAFWPPPAVGRRVLAIDLPGHGSTPPLRGESPTMARLARDVVALADRQGLDRVVLVGHSMGGAVAIEAAIALGERCERIIGVDTFTERLFYTPRPVEEIAARQAGFAADFAGKMRRMVGAITDPATRPGLRDWISATAAATDPGAALDTLEGLLSFDIEARWPLLACPVSTINSTFMAARTEQLTLPGLDLRFMDGVGHFPMLEAPERFEALLLAILDGEDRS